MTDTPPPLADLGWSPHFAQQLHAEEHDAQPMRIATVHRARMSAQSPDGPVKLMLPHGLRTTDFAVGDWVLTEPETNLLLRRLTRSSLLQRKTDGSDIPQLIAANIDTLFIVTSCNDDFNAARLERYLAVAASAGITPVIVLTKSDTSDSPSDYVTQAAALQEGLAVVTLNAKSADAAITLAPWCGAGRTVALVGSSGVGKSTLLNTLSGKQGEDAQLTGGIREDDAKGRHTTTARSLHAIAQGGWAIDTPGIRTLHLGDVAEGLDILFSEISSRAPLCRFRDCTHAHEPHCAIQAAVTSGEIDPARFARWRKLHDENTANTPDRSSPKRSSAPRGRGKRR